MKSWKYILTVLLATGTFGGQVVLAEDKPVDQVASLVTGSVNQLIQVKDDTSLSGIEKDEKEMEARLNIIKDVLKLSADEITKLQDKLSKLPEFEKESREQVLKAKYQKALDDFSVYYTDESKKLSDVKTSDDAKALAEELKDYRDTTYNPEIKNIANFTVLFYDADVVKTGKTRLSKINADISRLEKLGYLKTGVFADRLKKAQKLLDEAAKLQQEAAAIVLAPEPVPAEVVAEENATTEETVEAADKAQVVEEPKDPGDLTSQSLQNVKDTYDIFLQIGKDLKKYLGIK